jgi:hypothetical protein
MKKRFYKFAVMKRADDFGWNIKLKTGLFVAAFVERNDHCYDYYED